MVSATRAAKDPDWAFVPLGAMFLSLSEMWHMSKPVMTFVFEVQSNRLLRYILGTCPNLWWRSCSKCYAIDCFGTNLTHVQTCDDVRVQSATQSTASLHTWNMSCDDVHVQSATQSTVSVHTWNISLVAYALQPYETMYTLYITTKYLGNCVIQSARDQGPETWLFTVF